MAHTFRRTKPNSRAAFNWFATDWYAMDCEAAAGFTGFNAHFRSERHRARHGDMSRADITLREVAIFHSDAHDVRLTNKFHANHDKRRERAAQRTMCRSVLTCGDLDELDINCRRKGHVVQRRWQSEPFGVDYVQLAEDAYEAALAWLENSWYDETDPWDADRSLPVVLYDWELEAHIEDVGPMET